MPDLPDRPGRPVDAAFDPNVVEIVVEAEAEDEDEDRPFGSVAVVRRAGLDLREHLDGPDVLGDLGRIAERHDEPHIPPDA